MRNPSSSPKTCFGCSIHGKWLAFSTNLTSVWLIASLSFQAGVSLDQEEIQRLVVSGRPGQHVTAGLRLSSPFVGGYHTIGVVACRTEHFRIGATVADEDDGSNPGRVIGQVRVGQIRWCPEMRS